MQIHEIKRKTKNRKKRIIGRGGKHAKTSGRGTKGQTARAGNKKRPELRDIIKKLPKLRGRGKNIFQSFEIKPFVVNLADIEGKFAKGEEVTPKTLLAKQIIKKDQNRMPVVKILGTGDISTALTFHACLVSASAKAKIEKAGGMVK
jgi:large subunit ribosomal protein L15